MTGQVRYGPHSQGVHAVVQRRWTLNKANSDKERAENYNRVTRGAAREGLRPDTATLGSERQEVTNRGTEGETRYTESLYV